MKTIQLAALLSLSAGSTVVGQQAVQWRVSEGGNGHWYQLTLTMLPWADAQQVSILRGGYLATVTSGPENSFANGLCVPALAGQPTPASVWLGGFANPGNCSNPAGYSWVSGEPWGFTNWHPVEPNASFECRLSYRPGYGDRWNNFSAESACAYLVEWSADCNNDGIVDYGQILQGHLPDTNANGVPDGCECTDSPSLPACCIGNLNGDTAVDGADLGILLNAWGTCAVPCSADLNRDGFVDGADLGILLGRWGTCPP
jgi:hypothetical protein